MNAVVVVAGGVGRRMGNNIPKQYLDLDGKPLIIHTLEKFLQFDPDMKVVLVMASGHRKFWDVISISYDYGSGIIIAAGGETRYESVKNGLQYIEDGLIVGIHDAVRPFVSPETIKRCYLAAAESGCGIPVVEMDESVRMIQSPDHSVYMDRSKLRRVQTPQVFKSEMIKKAYRQPCDLDFSDDASVFESHYKHVTLVEGNRENIKITTPTDLQLASVLIERRD
ncbi:MAG: 2-C-methyl-D-erythritol 4-phosphate cytidylyltransferase [Bacteroidales bacterium]|nr:2-C-methyl-D-erythritol 4-phosphate cytidylyltransferase [Bacteroidales bacterium]